MTVFLVLAALLCAVAIAFATMPLWRAHPTLAVVLAVALPLAGAGLYGLKGEPGALEPQNVAAPSTMQEAIVQLQRHLREEPGNIEGWVLLGRSQMTAGEFAQARDAFAQAWKLQPGDPDLAVEYAESMLRTAPDRRFPPEAVQLLEQALARQPGNQRALFFLGMQQLQDAQPASAAQTWEKLLPLLDGEAADALRPQIDLARAAGGLPPLPPTTAAAGPGVTVEVRLDPALASTVKPGEVLYVFARLPGGAGPPLAVKRLTADALPLEVRLTDADSPMPAARLSGQDRVQLVARLSRTGDVARRSGDIEATPVDARVGGSDVPILILSKPVP